MFTVNYVGNHTPKCYRAAAVGILSGIIRREQNRRIMCSSVALLAGAFIDMATIENFKFSTRRRLDVNAALGSASERSQLVSALVEAIRETSLRTTNDEIVVGANDAAREILLEFMKLFELSDSNELISA
ncbi:MAG: hypothetical protein WBP22_04490 [Candidatus Saccharimonas sp.]